MMRIDSVAILVKRASLEFDKLAAPRLQKYDITPSQYKVLKLVAVSPAHTVRQVDVEKRFSMTNPTVTGLVRNLEAKGLVRRETNPHDARSKVIDLTESGEAIKDDLFRIGEELEREFTRDLTEQEHAQLVDLLGKVVHEER